MKLLIVAAIVVAPLWAAVAVAVRKSKNKAMRTKTNPDDSTHLPGYAIFRGAGGYPHERKHASEILEIGKSYKVTGGVENQCVTYIELEGVKGSWNTALFECDRDTLPFARMIDRYRLPDDMARVANPRL